MLPAPVVDPRLASKADPRLGRTVMKALGRRRVPGPPTAAQTEAERPFWGKHWHPGVSQIEEAFYSFGQRFLVGLLSAVLGRAVSPRTLVKAGFVNLQAPVEGWGKVADLFASDRHPLDIMDGWEKVIGKLTDALAPAGNQQAAAEALAIRSHMLARMNEAVKRTHSTLPDWETVWKTSTPHEQLALAWTRERGMEYARHLTERSRHSLVTSLIDSRQAHESPKALERRLLDQFGGLNRDWRRLALTESAFAVQNAALGAVDPNEGWIAVWSAAPNACPYCRAQHHRKFRVVAPDNPSRDGDNDIWVGKNNIGRSSHRYSTKLGRYRERPEMWWPCVPAHPNCACLLTVRPPRGGALRPKPTLSGS